VVWLDNRSRSGVADAAVQMRPAQARGSTQTLLKQHDQHTDALGRRRLPTTGKNPHPLQKFSLFAEQTLLFLSWCVWAIPCGRPCTCPCLAPCTCPCLAPCTWPCSLNSYIWGLPQRFCDYLRCLQLHFCSQLGKLLFAELLPESVQPFLRAIAVGAL